MGVTGLQLSSRQSLPKLLISHLQLEKTCFGKLTDCSSQRDSSECTASVCLLQTPEALGRQHIWRWGYWGPEVSAEQTQGCLSICSHIFHRFSKCKSEIYTCCTLSNTTLSLARSLESTSKQNNMSEEDTVSREWVGRNIRWKRFFPT